LSLTFVGTGPDEGVLRELADAHRIGDSVRFLGQVPKPAMFETMRSHDAFLFTSLHDTSGNALLEAMALGLPCILLNHHGPAEITTEDSALQVPVTDERETTMALAHAMERLAGSSELPGQIGGAAMTRAAEFFTWSSHADTLDRFYGELVSPS
jgi:glycosyltransferase involved in cell wall biosynthesis